MAQLFFKYGAMNSGKSIEILKVAHNYEEQNKSVLLFTSAIDDRDEVGYVSSRIGIRRQAIPIYDETDIISIVKEQEVNPACILIDESQFLSREHILDLAHIVDILDIPVMAFGLKNDFQNELFTGSKYLLLYADKIEEIMNLIILFVVITIHTQVKKELKEEIMFDQLDSFIIRYDELSELLSDPDVISDTKRFMELTKEESNLRPKVETFKRYQQVVEEIGDTEEMLGEGLDSEMAEMAKEELASLKKEKVELEEKIKFLLLPEDPNDGKNIIMEIRGAAGGDEAALFAGDLLSMYQKYAESQGWRVEVMDANITGIGGYKEVILMITGDNVFSKLKYESGAHRVQRVPSTESQGRVHTSTATVVVMPEAEEVEIELEDKDIRVDIYDAAGAGGQHVYQTASAVRLTD